MGQARGGIDVGSSSASRVGLGGARDSMRDSTEPLDALGSGSGACVRSRSTFGSFASRLLLTASTIFESSTRHVEAHKTPQTHIQGLQRALEGRPPVRSETDPGVKKAVESAGADIQGPGGGCHCSDKRGVRAGAESSWEGVFSSVGGHVGVNESLTSDIRLSSTRKKHKSLRSCLRVPSRISRTL